MSLAEAVAQEWRIRLQRDYPNQNQTTRESIFQWLIGEDPERFNALSASQLAVAKQAVEYRYRILCERYWGSPPERAYQKLLQRLGSLFLIRSKVRTWISLSRDRHRTVVDVLQEVIQEMLQSDGHLRRQVIWIAQCTSDLRLRNILTFASVEEYCLRPIRNQPLLVYRFVNYLRRSQKGGMTQVPSGDLVRLVSEDISSDEEDNSLSLLDFQAVTNYQEQQTWEEQQAIREQVKQKFSSYLSEHIDATASKWLELYLQGHTQEVIAQRLNLPIRQVYRLREKISYHAIRVFTLKDQPDLIFSWLKTSLKEHSLGLTPSQWEGYLESLAPDQQQLLEQLKAGRNIEAIARELNVKPKQVIGEWAKLYLAAQELRGAL